MRSFLQSKQRPLFRFSTLFKLCRNFGAFPDGNLLKVEYSSNDETLDLQDRPFDSRPAGLMSPKDLPVPYFSLLRGRAALHAVRAARLLSKHNDFRWIAGACPRLSLRWASTPSDRPGRLWLPACANAPQRQEAASRGNQRKSRKQKGRDAIARHVFYCDLKRIAVQSDHPRKELTLTDRAIAVGRGRKTNPDAVKKTHKLRPTSAVLLSDQMFGKVSPRTCCLGGTRWRMV